MWITVNQLTVREEQIYRTAAPSKRRRSSGDAVRPVLAKTSFWLLLAGALLYSSSMGWRILRKSEMGTVVVIQVDNATPIVLNREKFVTLGILGTTAW